MSRLANIIIPSLVYKSAMKKLYILILLMVIASAAQAQFTVSGQVLRTNGDSVQGAIVHIYPDTSSGPLTFTPVKDTTNSSGVYSVQLPSIPIGSKYFVSTLDCDSSTYVINQLTYAGSSQGTNLIICVTASSKFSGYVYLGSPSLRPQQKDAWVYLISKCPGDVLSYVDTLETDTNGYFQVDTFPTLGTGCQLVMKAALKTTSSDYKKYLPAYHQSATAYSLRWSGGKEISKADSKNGVIILLPEAINPFGGPSVLAGHAIDDASQMKLADKVLFITDMSDVTVDHTFTDVNGNFSFTNLQFGTYKLFGDVWSKDNPDLVVTVDADHVSYYNIVFHENSTEFKGVIAVSVADNTLSNDIQVYPNPVQDYIYIYDAGNRAGDKTVTLLNTTGAVLFSQHYSTDNTIAVPVQALPQGIYILNITTTAGRATYRIAK